MRLSQAGQNDFRDYICHPQKYGTWCMRIELSDKQASTLTTFLNIPDYRLSRRRWSSSDERPPILLPRLFAYIRAAIPQKVRESLPDLIARADISYPSQRRYMLQRRGVILLRDNLTPPPRLGRSKLHRLQQAAKIYQQNFQSCRINLVPENSSKIDITSRDPLTYFQISEELPGSLLVASPSEIVLYRIKDILEVVAQEKLEAEVTKMYSPESSLMEMYLPMLRLIPLSLVIKSRTAADNVQQALDEAKESRFVHAIRAIGIAAEELLVEIFETYLREKAPEAPLGNLINEFNSRLQEVLQGVKATKENPIGVVRKKIGKTIEAEKSSTNGQGLLLMADLMQNNIIPLLENLKQYIDDNPTLSLKAQRVNLFPSHVQRCISELVTLRNRVSHRVERAVSISTVGYIETAISLRDFIVVASWWEGERRQINYKASRKTIIQETVKRSRSQEQEPEISA